MVLSLHKWLAVSLVAMLHPFFVSVTEINHNAKEKSLEISCRIFTDDFEKTLTTASKAKVDILHPSDKKKTEKLISDYISKHLRIKVDGKPVVLSFIGYEQQEEAIWNYFEVNGIASFKSIEISDDLLFETHEEQTNMVHVMQNGNRQSREVRNPQSNLKFDF